MAEGPHIKHMFSADDEDCLRLEELRAYHEGGLPVGERHRVERHLLNCDLCAMAYEGILEMPDDELEVGQEAIVAAAWARVEEKKKRRGAWIWLSAAAGVMLLVTTAYLVTRGPSDEELPNLAQHYLDETSPSDSLAQSGIAQLNATDTESAAEELLLEQSEGGRANPQGATATKEPVPSLFDGNQFAPQADRTNQKGAGDDGWSKPDAQAKTTTAARPFTEFSTGKDNVRTGSIATVEAEEDVELKDQGGYTLDADDGIRDERKAADPKVANAEKTEQQLQESISLNEVTATSKKSTIGPKGSRKEENAKESVKGKQGKAPTQIQRSKTMNDDKYDVPTDAENEDFVTSDMLTPSKAPEIVGGATMDSVVFNAIPAQRSLFEQGLDAYGRKDYATAATQLRAAAAQTPSNLQAHLYAANAFLNIGQPEAALYHLDRILAQPGNSYMEEAKWYKALAYLKMKERGQATKLLEDIQEDGGKFSDDAGELLEDLD